MLYKNPLFYKRLHLPYHSHLVVACSQMYLQKESSFLCISWSSGRGNLDSSLHDSVGLLLKDCDRFTTARATVKEQSWSMVVRPKVFRVLRFSIANWLLGRGTGLEATGGGGRAATGGGGRGEAKGGRGKGRPRRREKRGATGGGGGRRGEATGGEVSAGFPDCYHHQCFECVSVEEIDCFT